MPIRFRCKRCGQLLSITRRKAGQVVTCPECVHRTRVPQLKSVTEVAAADLEDEAEDAADLRLSVVRAEGKLGAAETREIWLREINPWLVDEEDEEPDFNLARASVPDDGLDMTPMVDVTFLLLIFFMITASFSLQKSMETSPPEPDEDTVTQTMNLEDLEENSVVVEIDNEDALRVDDVAVSSYTELMTVLTSKVATEQKTELLIEADAAATHGAVVTVTDIGISAGMQRVRRSSKRSDE